MRMGKEAEHPSASSRCQDRGEFPPAFVRASIQVSWMLLLLAAGAQQLSPPGTTARGKPFHYKGSILHHGYERNVAYNQRSAPVTSQ